MLPYSSIPTSSTATSNPSTAYHGSSNTPYPLYNNQFPTPSPYPTGSANTSNFPPYTPPYTTQNSSQNCPYPQQPAPIRPEYPPYPSTTSNLPNPSTGVRLFLFFLNFKLTHLLVITMYTFKKKTYLKIILISIVLFYTK